jgi:DNA-nicking Smr family endonuclease
MTAENDRPRRGRRPLRDEERALWKEVTRSMKPLSRKARAATAAVIDDDASTTEAKKPPPPPAKRPKPIKPAAPPPVVIKPVAVKAPPPLAPLGRRERSRVARGHTEIDGRIDLHGMTQDEAHGALSHFLRSKQRDGARLVLVITGKGARSGSEGLGRDDFGRERGVLKRQVPMWLRLPGLREIVVGFEDAGIGHGGTGALYVRLRARR